MSESIVGPRSRLLSHKVSNKECLERMKELTDIYVINNDNL